MHDVSSRVRRGWTVFASILILLAGCRCAAALNPSVEISQYAHTAWKVRDGFVDGSITAIAQTTDGYLWIGTEFDLFRFDGIRAVPWRAITYDDRQLRLQVRDDGKGIDPVQTEERRGHFGLPGMRERAELVGGRLDVWSEVGGGTEIDLTIPADKAYAAARARRRVWGFAKKTGAA